LRGAMSCPLMTTHMKRCFRRGALMAALALTLAGCGNRETKQALQKAQALEDQKQYQDANDVLIDALRAREAVVRAKLPTPTDQLSIDDLTKKVQADPEILKMEKAQVPLYLKLQRPDLTSAVYSDILQGDPKTTVVFDALKDKDPTIRLEVVRVLVLAGQHGSIPVLASATKDANQDVRRAAVAALGTIKDPNAVPPLIDALHDSYWFVRSDAADALSREHDARAIKPLLDTVADSDSTVESSAENALVMLADLKAGSTDDFAGRLNDPNPRIANIAAVCLAVQKDRRATPYLLKMATSTDSATRLQAVEALGEAGDASVLPTLRQMLNDPDVNVRGWSIIGLGKLNDQSSVPQLRQIAADPSSSPGIQQAATTVVNRLTWVPPNPESPAASSQ
jgi:HEAT repeat protein